MRMKRPALAAVAGLALLGTAPAHAAIVYAYSRPGAQYVMVRPDFVTGNTTQAFDSCAPAACVSAAFQQIGGGDRLVVTENDGGFHTTTHDFDDGAFGTQGIHRDGDAMLAIADVGSYAKGSVLYLLSSPRGVFSYISDGLLDGDTAFLAMTSCLASGHETCGGIRFDFAELAGSPDRIVFRLFPSSGSSTLIDYDFPRGAFGQAGAYFAEDSFLRRLAVIPLPGGASPPAAVPEPMTWALLIAGFGAVGGMARRRRRAAA